jgi:hypothetical protein
MRRIGRFIVGLQTHAMPVILPFAKSSFAKSSFAKSSFAKSRSFSGEVESGLRQH